MLPVNYRSPLVRYAIDQMYANAGIARQFQLKLNQVSPDTGYVNTFQLMGRYRKTPIEQEYFLMFNMSGFDGSTWNFHNLFTRTDPVDQWLNVAKICKERGMIIDIYGDDGRMFPRDKCWVMSTYDGQQLLAVRNLRAFKHGWRKPMYLHCYTIQTTVYDPQSNPNSLDWPRFYSNDSQTLESMDKMKIVYNQYLNLPGLTSVYLNGYLWNGFPNTASLTGNDVIELTNDPSVVAEEIYEVETLENFQSKLDQTRKFIIHPPKEEDFTYRYVNDVAFYLTNDQNQGVYLNRNDAGNFRQLTHRDYAVNARMVNDIANTTGLLEDHKLNLRLVYRKNDYAKVLQYETNGVRWLYRMDDQHIVGALVDVNSTVPEWQARNLEQSPANLFLNTPFMSIDHEQAVASVGYNRATQVLCGSPITYDPTKGEELEVPVSARVHLTMFEYDDKGLFLRMCYFNKVNFVKPSSDAYLVEFYPGEPGIKINHVYGNDPVTVDRNVAPRFYYQAVTTGGDLAGNKLPAVENEHYTFDRATGVVTWKLNANMFTGVVVMNDKTLYKAFTLNHLDNSLTFSITHQWEGGGVLADIAPANIMVIMNGRSLIENVDYVVRFPDVFIINHQFLKADGNDFVLYCSEWSPIDDETPVEQSELGYVMGGVIGHNQRYNLREDRIVRLTMAGQCWDPAKVPSAELTAPSEVLNPYNGYPYGVKHWYLPLRDWVDYAPEQGWSEARDRDIRMSAYLTEFAEKPAPVAVPSIMDKYRLYSPFMNAIVNQLLLGVLELDDLADGETYSNDYIMRKTEPYRWWLTADPVTLRFDARYFAVFPYVQQTTVTVSPKQLIFIRRINELFLENRVNVTGHFEVKDV